jgi:hypothetical protein
MSLTLLIQSVNQSLACMETESSLPSSQRGEAGPYPKTDEPSSHPHMSFLSNKGKVIPELQASRHEDAWGRGGIDQVFLTSELVGSEWSASRPGRFIPEERAPRTHWIGDWVDARAGLDDMEK